MKKLLLTAATFAALAGQAEARTFCTVADPSTTPLNVRSRPMGTILGALNNGTEVMLDDMTVANGDKWAKVIPAAKGAKSGWVYYKYLDCE